MSWFLQTLENFKIEKKPKIFCETGSYLGENIQYVLDANYFDKVHSIEISEKWYNYCKDKYNENEKVFLHLGNSADVIRNYDFGDEPVLFYLDAHFSGGETGGSDIENGCPLLLELDSLCETRKKNTGDIVIIDDMRLMGIASWGGTEGDKVYPKTFFDFTHITFQAIASVFKKHNRTIQWNLCPDKDRMIILL